MQTIMLGVNNKQDRAQAFKAENSYTCQSCATISWEIKECSECFEYNCKECLTKGLCAYCGE